MPDSTSQELTDESRAALHRPPSREVFAEARGHLEKALALDAKTVDAVIGLAYTYARALNSGFADDSDAADARGMELANSALAMAPQRAQAPSSYSVEMSAPV